ncbi:hypothetical protein Q8A73_005291 [Channa argus]|nr:hypothetical protein Q8A73_005291 [Channa argus]
MEVVHCFVYAHEENDLLNEEEEAKAELFLWTNVPLPLCAPSERTGERKGKTGIRSRCIIEEVSTSFSTATHSIYMQNAGLSQKMCEHRLRGSQWWHPMSFEAERLAPQHQEHHSLLGCLPSSSLLPPFRVQTSWSRSCKNSLPGAGAHFLFFLWDFLCFRADTLGETS